MHKNTLVCLHRHSSARIYRDSGRSATRSLRFEQFSQMMSFSFANLRFSGILQRNAPERAESFLFHYRSGEPSMQSSLLLSLYPLSSSCSRASPGHFRRSAIASSVPRSLRVLSRLSQALSWKLGRRCSRGIDLSRGSRLVFGWKLRETSFSRSGLSRATPCKAFDDVTKSKRARAYRMRVLVFGFIVVRYKAKVTTGFIARGISSKSVTFYRAAQYIGPLTFPTSVSSTIFMRRDLLSYD